MTQSLRMSDWQTQSRSGLSRTPLIMIQEKDGTPFGMLVGSGTLVAHAEAIVPQTSKQTSVCVCTEVLPDRKLSPSGRPIVTPLSPWSAGGQRDTVSHAAQAAALPPRQSVSGPSRTADP